MPLTRAHLHCSICGDELTGRSDKKFCDHRCKNEYHRRRKEQHLPFSNSIDQLLHRNWVVLQEWADKIGTKKFFVPKAALSKAGFHTKYYTTSKSNKQGKTYYYVYNYGWMDFSEKEMMVIKMSKSQ